MQHTRLPVTGERFAPLPSIDGSREELRELLPRQTARPEEFSVLEQAADE